MADVVVCPNCNLPVVIAQKGGVAVCRACGGFVMLLDLGEGTEGEDSTEKKSAKSAKAEPGSKSRKRRAYDDDDYDHDYPRGRRPRRGSGLNGTQIAGIVALVVVAVIGGTVGVASVATRLRAKPNAPPAVAGPNLNPNLNPVPRVPVPRAPDARGAEAALPAVEPPFEIDPLLEEPAPPVYLADMSEFGVRMGPWRFGKGELGDGAGSPIRVNGTPGPKGLSVHPREGVATRVAYALGGRAVTLAGAAALNDYGSEAWGTVVFTIVGDGRELWRSGPVNRASGSARFRVDVSGVKVLELRAILSGAHLHAHAVWVDPVIEK
jgi:hypothetical protein